MTSSDTEKQTPAYSTKGGRRYHASPACPALRGGQDFWDSDEWSGYPVREETPQGAANRGRTPCVVCKPLVVEVPLFGQTFGHEPVLGFVDGWGAVPVCVRCRIPVKRKYVALVPEGLSVPWPCVSAVVLGLAECPEVTP